MRRAVGLHHLREDVALGPLAGDGDARLAVDFQGPGRVLQLILRADAFVDEGARERRQRHAVDVDAEGAQALAQRAHIVQPWVALLGDAGHIFIQPEVDGVGAERHLLAQPFVGQFCVVTEDRDA